MINTEGLFEYKQEQDKTIPVRYPKKEINIDLFSKFFNKFG